MVLNARQGMEGAKIAYRRAQAFFARRKPRSEARTKKRYGLAVTIPHHCKAGFQAGQAVRWPVCCAFSNEEAGRSKTKEAHSDLLRRV